MIKNRLKKDKYIGGYVLILSTMALSALAGLVIVGLLSLSSLYSSDTLHQIGGLKAKTFAETCAELALMEIREQQQFSGTQSHSISDGSCNFQVLDQGGDNREIQAEGIYKQYTKRFIVSITAINPEIEVSSFEEVSSF